MAGLTRNVRLGPAVVVMPSYEPVRLIEDIFYVDHRSMPFAVQRYTFVVDNRNDARAAAEQVLAHNRMAANMRRQSPLMKGAWLQAPPFENEPTVEQMLDYSLIGSAEEVAEKIVREVNEYGITHMTVFMQFAAMPYEQTLSR